VYGERGYGFSGIPPGTVSAAWGSEFGFSDAGMDIGVPLLGILGEGELGGFKSSYLFMHEEHSISKTNGNEIINVIMFHYNSQKRNETK
jgi:hypothetical protein